APARVYVSLRKKGGDYMVHLVNMGCGHPLSPKNVLVEDVPPVGPVHLDIPLDNPPDHVFLMPGNIPLPWKFADGRFRLDVPEVSIHDIVVIGG
ncbi:MAG TPA: hypothetical protein DD727_00385, partial [Clostridiales bacterium]|nr:hypothetical protein [Clostridiales bacterium]